MTNNFISYLFFGDMSYITICFNLTDLDKDKDHFWLQKKNCFIFFTLKLNTLSSAG